MSTITLEEFKDTLYDTLEDNGYHGIKETYSPYEYVISAYRGTSKKVEIHYDYGYDYVEFICRHGGYGRYENSVYANYGELAEDSFLMDKLLARL